MSNPNDSISLLQTLPCSWGGSQCGWIDEIGLSSVRVKIKDSTTVCEKNQYLRLQITLTNNSMLSLAGRFIAAEDEWYFAIEGEESLARLRDLSAQVRKDQHIEICQYQDVEASDQFTGFERIHFIPNALPELSVRQIDTSKVFLGRRFSSPLLITGMTGGVDKGAQINRLLAQAAAEFNIPMGVGSQRIALDNPQLAVVFDVKKYQPDVFLIANLGFAQLRRADYIEQCRRAVDMIKADALAIHLNVMQELIQVEGDRDFNGIVERIGELCKAMEVPVVVKEVGSGISTDCTEKLLAANVSAVDVGGRGGTSWGYIEGLRSSSFMTQSLAHSFRNWGIPTAYSLVAARKVSSQLPLIATGGIRDGLMVAKAVALGADMVGIGLPLLRAALVGESQLNQVLATFVKGLEITMLATGSRSLQHLANHIVVDWPLQQGFDREMAAK